VFLQRQIDSCIVHQFINKEKSIALSVTLTTNKRLTVVYLIVRTGPSGHRIV
jgi:hypothetical protein